jgi:hypothetical protein
MAETFLHPSVSHSEFHREPPSFLEKVSIALAKVDETVFCKVAPGSNLCNKLRDRREALEILLVGGARARQVIMERIKRLGVNGASQLLDKDINDIL